MRVPVSWLRDYVDLPADVDGRRSWPTGSPCSGSSSRRCTRRVPTSPARCVVGRVLSSRPRSTPTARRSAGARSTSARPSRAASSAARTTSPWATSSSSRCPGAVLPGGFEIAARKTYGHVSDGMICSARELGLGDDHTGIIVLEPDAGQPGDDAAEVLHLRDDVIEFEINPDRAYALSLRGVAREAATAYGLRVPRPGDDAARGCGRRRLPGRRRGPERLRRRSSRSRSTASTRPRRRRAGWRGASSWPGCGPISLAVDVTNYVMLELGQPIHGYDKAALQGPIVVRRARAGEKLTTLDGVIAHARPRGPAHHRRPRADRAGRRDGRGGHRDERRDDLRRDRGRPLRPGHDRPRRAPAQAAERGVQALRARHRPDDLGGRGPPRGRPAGRARRRTRSPTTATVVGDADGSRADHDRRPAARPGSPGSRSTTQTAADALRTVGCEVDAGRTAAITATPPPWRPTSTDPYDLVEEVLRIVGYDKVPSVLPAAPAGRGLTKRQRLRRRVGIALAALGYVEALAYPFVGDRDLDGLGLPADDERRAALRIANPLSEQEPLLRTTLLPGLLRNAGAQRRPGAERHRAVRDRAASSCPGSRAVRRHRRWASTARRRSTSSKQLERRPARPAPHVGVVLAGARGEAGWWGAAAPRGWADAIEAAREVGRALGLDADGRGCASTRPGTRAAARVLLVGETAVGYAGELHPKVCTAFGVPARTCAAELDLDALIQQAPDITVAQPFSTYPGGQGGRRARRRRGCDVGSDVEAALRAGAGELLESVRLFDVYTGEQVGAGKKSLAFSLRFRAPDRTLTEAEIKAARDAAVADAAERTGAVQRA